MPGPGRREPSEWLRLGTALGATGLVAVGCADKAKAPEPPKLVSAARLSPQTVRVYREYVGRTEALLSVDLKPQVSAYVTGYFFKEGQAVRKGQLLFQLDARAYQAALQAARARLAKADADVAEAQAQLDKAQDYVRRYAPLATVQAIPRQDYTDALAEARVRAAELQQMQADRRIALADIARAEVDLGYTQVRAPISGVVGFRGVATGGLAGPSDATPLATVSQSDPVRVGFSISDADYLRYLAPGQETGAGAPQADAERTGRIAWRLKLADGSTYDAPGRFYAIGRAANVQTDTVLVELLYPNPQGRLRPGQYVQVRADVEVRRGVLLVPVSSVRVSQGAKVVSVVGPSGEVGERSIETGDRSGDAYIVTGGLKAGDVVVVGGEQKVKPGDKVKLHMEPQPTGVSDDPARSFAPGAQADPQAPGPHSRRIAAA